MLIDIIDLVDEPWKVGGDVLQGNRVKEYVTNG
jgi:hypothetical protein